MNELTLNDVVVYVHWKSSIRPSIKGLKETRSYVDKENRNWAIYSVSDKDAIKQLWGSSQSEIGEICVDVAANLEDELSATNFSITQDLIALVTGSPVTFNLSIYRTED